MSVISILSYVIENVKIGFIKMIVSKVIQALPQSMLVQLDMLYFHL